jgi:hypothetical protein
MLRFRKLYLLLLLASFVLIARTLHAALILRYDLQSVCYMSSDVVEATLVRNHQPGKPVWSDTYTATVLNSLEGKYKAGDQIKRLDLELYSPDQISRHCLLFIAPAGYLDRSQPQKSGPPEVVDMLLIDNKGFVHHYHQQENPGSLVADYSPRSSHPTLAEERILIMSNWTAARKLKAPPPGLPYQVLR